MISTEDIKNKEVINICDGCSLGYVYDIELNLQDGFIEGIIVPSQRSGFSLLPRGREDYLIRWQDIRTIGEDVILVEVKNLFKGYNM